jgi:hypothetical protein
MLYILEGPTIMVQEVEMEPQVIAFAGSEASCSDQQSTTVAPTHNRRPPASRSQRLALTLLMLLISAVTVTVLLITSGTIPHILYDGGSVSLVELNDIHARGQAAFCVQQPGALAHVIGMSFEYQCFDSEAEADANVREVEAQLRAP